MPTKYGPSCQQRDGWCLTHHRWYCPGGYVPTDETRQPETKLEEALRKLTEARQIIEELVRIERPNR